jgi:hypothetical protein
VSESIEMCVKHINFGCSDGPRIFVNSQKNGNYVPKGLNPLKVFSDIIEYSYSKLNIKSQVLILCHLLVNVQQGKK